MAIPPASASPSLQDDAFFVGPWVVQPSLHSLHAPTGDSVTLEPKVMQVLVCLAAAPGKVVTRDELHACGWPDTFVTDKVLTRAISELRKAFGDTPQDPAFIATIPKTGYRLIAPVRYPSSGDASPSSPPTSATLTLPLRTPARPGRTWSVIGLAMVLGGMALVWQWNRSSGASPARTPPLALTTTPGVEVSPALSPAGETVAFAWKGPEDDNWDIYVKQPGGETALRLTDHPGDDTHPVWSPDGAHIAFARYTDSECSIVLVPALSGPERTLASCFWYPDSDYGVFAPKFDWSPDGQTIAFVDRASRQAPSHIALLDLETDSIRQVTFPPPRPRSEDHDPRFSSEGTQIAFLRSWGRGIEDLHSVDLDTGEETRMTQDYRMILGHDWTPDDRQLVISSNRNGTFDLWTIPSSGGAPRWIPASGWNLKAPSFARDGTRLAYENWSYDTNLWRVDLATDASDTQAIASSLWDVTPDIAPDGERVAFVSNRGGSYELWVSQPDGSQAVALTAFGGPLVSSPRWSPDGRQIAFEVRRTGPANVYVVDADGGIPRQITNTDTDEVAVSWSPDGAWLYFGSNATDTWQIHRVRSAGGRPEQVTQTGGYTASVALDGTLYTARHGESGLWRHAPDGGTTLLIPDLAVGDWGNWSLTEEGIYFVRRDSRPVELAFYSFATGQTTSVRALSPAPPRNQRAISLSPDRQWLLQMRLDEATADLMMLDHLPAD
ncbi:MAG: winged helix-turn-helix domain-containing protein [Rubricoccaceae bacterium]